LTITPGLLKITEILIVRVHVSSTNFTKSVFGLGSARGPRGPRWWRIQCSPTPSQLGMGTHSQAPATRHFLNLAECKFVQKLWGVKPSNKSGVCIVENKLFSNFLILSVNIWKTVRDSVKLLLMTNRKLHRPMCFRLAPRSMTFNCYKSEFSRNFAILQNCHCEATTKRLQVRFRV